MNERVEFVDNAYFVPSGGEDPPPSPPPGFTPYAAKYFKGENGCIISHDQHLNEDGEALYRFLLAQSHKLPQLFLHVKGEHQEHQTRRVASTDDDGQTHYKTHSETVTVFDFDFCIDASRYVLPRPTQWTVSDEEPAYRGAMALEVDGGLTPESARRKATSKECEIADAWNEKKKARGLPPWAGVGGDEGEILSSTRSMRAWVDEYCASTKMLKEFTYKKSIYGWNFSALEAAVAAAVRSTHYMGELDAHFTRRADEVHVRANNWLAHHLSHTWLYSLLWATLLYPFVWFFQHFSRDGGGRWEVCGGAYALVSRRLVDPADEDAYRSQPPPPPPTGSAGSTSSRRTFVRTQWDVTEIVGTREGEWFQEWEGTIKRAVQRGLRSDDPLTKPDDGPLEAAMVLDGYQARPPVYL
ncbi:hypothetical protein BDW22DRAFT_1350815 [Trametopsis cervina]|nr:hypothetical protein BDW22DRAFT_1350815 [Trametopsis cervina]